MKRGKIRTLAAALLIAACGGDSDGGGCSGGYGSNGEIGDGTFQYVCRDSDQACANAPTSVVESTTLPKIARGGTFGLAIRSANDAGIPETKLVPAVGLAFETRGAGFYAKAEGIEPMLAIDRSGLVVVDLVHLHVVVPTTIAMSGGPATALAVGAEQSITATVRANGEDGGAPVPVAGVAATFAVADETVAAILSQRDGVARIVGRRVGQTELTAVLPGDNGELKTRVSIRVEGALPADGGTDATVGSTDAGITEGGADAK